MASTGLDVPPASRRPTTKEILSNKLTEGLPSKPLGNLSTPYGVDDEKALAPYSPEDPEIYKSQTDRTHRRLKPRHIQLIGIGGWVIFYWSSWHQYEISQESTDAIGFM